MRRTGPIFKTVIGTPGSSFRIVSLHSRRGHHEFRYALVGPDGAVWHQSYYEKALGQTLATYTAIYEMGREAGRAAPKDLR